MSAADPDATTIQLRRGARVVQRFGTIVVCGGGCYGSYYVRQLQRASAAGAIQWQDLLVVDRDAGCRVAAEGAAPVVGDGWRRVSEAARAGGPPRHQHRDSDADAQHRSPAPRVVVSPWTEFFDAYLSDALADGAVHAADAIVPSPLMPHLMFEWLVRRAAARWPARRVTAEPLGDDPGMPWHRHAEHGTYVSFAEWMCPINCVEPARCPETRGTRDWSVAPSVRALVARSAALPGERALAGPALLECVHRAYGVGMFDTAAVLRADAVVEEAAARAEARVVIGTVSHCHGALGVLHVGP